MWDQLYVMTYYRQSNIGQCKVVILLKSSNSVIVIAEVHARGVALKALNQSSLKASAVANPEADDASCFSPSPPSADEIAFDGQVAHTEGLLSSIANSHDAPDVGWTLEHALGSFEALRPGLRRFGGLSGSQRDELLAGLVEARAGAEVHCLGLERDAYVDGIRALQSLAVHYARSPRAQARMPGDRLGELWNLVRIAKNVAEIRRLQAENQAGEKRRSVPTLDFSVGAQS